MIEIMSHFDCSCRWLKLEGDQAAIWISLASVRQLVFSRTGGAPRALIWCDDGLWEISEPDAVEALREWVEGDGDAYPATRYGESLPRPDD